MFIRYQYAVKALWPFRAAGAILRWCGRHWIISGIIGLTIVGAYLDDDETSSSESSSSSTSSTSPKQIAGPKKAEYYSSVLKIAESSKAEPRSTGKDLLRAPAWKVNFYEDTGDFVFDRLKIDFERDGNWDEAFTRKSDGHWERDGDGMHLEALARTNGSSPYYKLPATSEQEQYIAVLNASRLVVKPNSSAKDITKGTGWKINIYEDTGDDLLDRIKIDKNRDDVWDEAWSIKSDGHWERDGDGVHLETLAGAPTSIRSIDGSSANTGAVQNSNPASVEAARYKAIFGLLKNRSAKPNGKIKDLSQGTGWKINLYEDTGDSVYDRVKIDFDRDDKWDETWKLQSDGSYKRESDGKSLDEASR